MNWREKSCDTQSKLATGEKSHGISKASWQLYEKAAKYPQKRMIFWAFQAKAEKFQEESGSFEQNERGPPKKLGFSSKKTRSAK